MRNITRNMMQQGRKSAMDREGNRNMYQGYDEGYHTQRNMGSGSRTGAEYNAQRGGYGSGNREMSYASQNINSGNRREGMQNQGGRRNGMRNGWEYEEERLSSEYASMHDDMEEGVQEFTRDIAEHWTSEMENADGTRGAHWRMDQALSLMQQVGAHAEPHVFYAIVNNMYRLYSKAAKKYGVDRPDFYGDIAKAWIEDADRMVEKCEKMMRKAKER